MDKEVLVPFEKADFIRNVIRIMEGYKRDNIGYDDDWSKDKKEGFLIGVDNAIYFLKKEIAPEKVK